MADPGISSQKLQIHAMRAVGVAERVALADRMDRKLATLTNSIGVTA